MGKSLIVALLRQLTDKIKKIEQRLSRYGWPGLPNEIQRLLHSLVPLADDAEEKLFSGTAPERKALKRWLLRLQDTAYSLEETLETELYYVDGLALRFTMGNLLKKLSCLLSEKGLGHPSAQIEKEGVGQESPRELPPYYLKLTGHVYGREKEKNQILEFLVSDSDDEANGGNTNISVLGIVGAGGIGKTTLAHLVYKDHKVREYFNLRVWLTFPYKLDALSLARMILGNLGVHFHPSHNLQELMPRLRYSLSGRRFLLVLDGCCWVVGEWEILRTCFESAVKGSAIILTTPTTEAALAMHADHILHLGVLSMDDCWSLFSEHCFENGNFSSNPQLEAMGKRILKKCGCLPVAAKMLGGLLHRKDYKVWEEIWRSKQWDSNVDLPTPFVSLCYLDLPAELKRCIAYLSMFPKGYKFEKKEVVLLWMAEGFLQPENGKNMEELGNEYFDFLLARSFLIRLQHNDGSAGFTMHDMVHDLALFLYKEFHCCLDGNYQRYPAYESTRHISCYPTLLEFFQVAWELKIFSRVRTFLSLHFRRQFLPESVSILLCAAIFSRSYSLRVLSLSHLNVVKLPDSIGRLTSLRYLDLSFASISTLSGSIGSLKNLQTLLLSFCENLSYLPQSMADMTNLHHLDIRGTNIQEMPSQMGGLTNLQMLTDFAVGKEGSEVAVLAELSNIQTLGITGLQNVVNPTDALNAKLKEKRDLVNLSLKWNQQDHLQQGVIVHQVLENFEPPKGVKDLEILGYPGTMFPNWLMDASFATLKNLHLGNCSNCSFLPPLGKFPFLKELSIEGCDQVISIGTEFYGMTATDVPFRSLEILRIANMLNWREWIVSEVEGIGFQCLHELYLINCPELVQGLPKYLPFLVKLQISECSHLTASLPMMPENCELLVQDCNEILMTSVVKLTSTSSVLQDDISEGKHEASPLASNDTSEQCGPRAEDANDAGQDRFDFGTYFETLKISDVSQLVELPPTLQSLRIEGCHSLESLQDIMMNKSTNLFELYIIDCCSLKYIADGWYPNSLRTLYVHKCRKLEFLLPVDKMQNFESLEHLCIGSSFDSLKSLTLNLFPKLRILCIWDCSNLDSLSIEECQNNNLSLESLEIRDCPNLVSFPTKGLLSPSLRSLSVSNCKNLRSLPNYMTTLTSLQSVFIDKCPELESLPVGGLPSCLTLLSIAFCDKLSPQKEWKLQRLYCLNRFEIESGCMGMKSFPEEDLLPSNLKSLYISKLPSLEVLDYNGLQRLTALESLEINCCKKLCSLPEALPSSLTFLCIKESSMLTQKLLNQAGADWLKIAHICNIQIDNSVISSNSARASFVSRNRIPISSNTKRTSYLSRNSFQLHHQEQMAGTLMGEEQVGGDLVEKEKVAGALEVGKQMADDSLKEEQMAGALSGEEQ